jgi:hypothetical protein
MFANKARVLLVLPQDVLDRARVMAGKATITLKLPVSVQIVLRGLIEEGLKRGGKRSLLGSIEEQAQHVRRIRSQIGRGGAAQKRGGGRAGSSRRPRGTGGGGRRR